MTTAVAGPFLIVCTILGIGGVAKLVAPKPARRALHALGVPAPLVAVRTLGLAEVVLACAAAVLGGTMLPILVGFAYVCFALFVALMLRSEQGTSCGCFGTSDTPPSWLHVGVNLVSAGVALAATGIDTLSATLSEQPAGGVPFIGLVVVGSYLLFLLLTALPALLAPPQPRVAQFSLTERLEA